MAFISIVKDFFFWRYTNAEKIKATIIFLQDKTQVWLNTLKRDQESCGLGSIATLRPLLRIFSFNNSFLATME